MSAVRETNNQIAPTNLPDLASEGELAPLNIIRTETAFSKYPVHNLAKKGRINIEIKEKGERGEVRIKWEVSYSDRYGQARQLAYKADTLLVNRKIDEAGRPLPKALRLGSLSELARELDLGKDTPALKKALLQNASLFITAKVTYRATDGAEKWLEFGATRYGLVFTGETLPDGKKADAVYVILNDPYREILNSAAVRPLDYDYLKVLAPAPQRWYEIISRQMYAVFKHHLPHLKYRYSDYCTYSAQQRYFDYDHFKKQMYKIHLPHIKSGYLNKPIRYEETIDSTGQIDWFMFYIPGPKAKAEYKAINSKKNTPKTIDIEAGGSPTLTSGKKASQQPSSEAKNEIKDAAPAPEQGSEGTGQPTIEAEDLLKYFYQHFHNVTITSFKDNPNAKQPLAQAQRLIASYGLEKTRYLIEYAKRAAEKTNFRIQVFGGVLQYEHQAVMEYDRRQIQLEQAKQAEQIAQEEIAKLQEQERAEQALRHRAQAHIDQLSPQDYKALYDRVYKQALEKFPQLATQRDDVKQSQINRLMILEVTHQLEAAPAPQAGE
jgi:hypothetical protein